MIAITTVDVNKTIIDERVVAAFRSVSGKYFKLLNAIRKDEELEGESDKLLNLQYFNLAILYSTLYYLEATSKPYKTKEELDTLFDIPCVKEKLSCKGVSWDRIQSVYPYANNADGHYVPGSQTNDFLEFDKTNYSETIL